MNVFPYWTPDGTVISAVGPTTSRSFDIYLLRSAGVCRSAENIEPELFPGEPFNEGFTQISPDGRWMLYAWITWVAATFT